jgi:hypothetical protein
LIIDDDYDGLWPVGQQAPIDDRPGVWQLGGEYAPQDALGDGQPGRPRSEREVLISGPAPEPESTVPTFCSEAGDDVGSYVTCDSAEAAAGWDARRWGRWA